MGGPTFSCPWYQLELTAVHWLWLWLWMWLVHRICEQTVWTVWGGNIALKSELWWEMDIGHLRTVLYLVPFALDDIDYCCPRAVKVGAMHCHFLCLCLCLYVGQVMFSHHCDQMSQRSQVAVCSKIKSWLSQSVSDIVTYWAVLRLCLKTSV